MALWLDRSISISKAEFPILGASLGTLAAVYILFSQRRWVTSTIAAIFGAGVGALFDPATHSSVMAELLWVSGFAMAAAWANLRFGPHRVAEAKVG
jgi:hypothetical protein